MIFKIQSLIVFVFLIVIGSSLQLKASSFEFLSKNEIVSGGLNDEIRAKAEIKNISGNVVNVKLKIEIISLTKGHSIVYCWDICYPPKEEDCTSDGYITLMPMATTGESFHADVFADGVTGESIVKYIFFNVDNPEDNISFTATYLVGLSSVEKTISDISYSLSEPSPNPANSLTNISFLINDNFTDAKLRFFDAQGFEVFGKAIYENSGNLSLDMLDLPQGVYFYNLEVDGLITETKKLILVK